MFYVQVWNVDECVEEKNFTDYDEARSYYDSLTSDDCDLKYLFFLFHWTKFQEVSDDLC